MDEIIERDGLYTLKTNRNYRCVCKHGRRWVGGTYNINSGQFCDGRVSARGMNAQALRAAFSVEFTTKRAALAWINEGR